MSKNAFHGPLSLIFKIIRVLFRYADNSSDLCVLNNKCLKNGHQIRNE